MKAILISILIGSMSISYEALSIEAMEPDKTLLDFDEEIAVKMD